MCVLEEVNQGAGGKAAVKEIAVRLSDLTNKSYCWTVSAPMNTPPARQTESYAVLWQEELMGGEVFGPPGHRLLPDGFSPIAKLRGDKARYDGVNAQELVLLCDFALFATSTARNGGGATTMCVLKSVIQTLHARRFYWNQHFQTIQ